MTQHLRIGGRQNALHRSTADISCTEDTPTFPLHPMFNNKSNRTYPQNRNVIQLPDIVQELSRDNGSRTINKM
eukprot:7846286-Ditylum_brightwellii.AAC.1